jgi:hypothetical protein
MTYPGSGASNLPAAKDPVAEGKKTVTVRADVPGMHLRIAQARAAERGAMVIITLLRSGLTGPQKWIAAESDGA